MSPETGVCGEIFRRQRRENGSWNYRALGLIQHFNPSRDSRNGRPASLEKESHDVVRTIGNRVLGVASENGKNRTLSVH